MKYIAYLILIITISFNLWLNYPETQILADPNDNIFQYSLVNRTDWVWRNYGCPLSFSCLPNLTDHLVPNWAEGYPLPFYYTHIPQIAIVSSYHLLIKPIASIFNFQFSIFNYYNWTKYLLYTLFPVPVFIALRLVGFNPVLSALTAFFASHYSTDGLYGIDPVSSLWRGYGLTSQLYGVFFLPLALAYTYRTLLVPYESKNSKHEIRNPKQIQMTKIQNSKQDKFWVFEHLNFGIVSNLGFRISNLFLAIIFLTLTTAGHLGVGIMAFLSLIPFLFLDLKKFNFISRFKKLAVIYLGTIFLLAYWIIPVLLNNNYHIISFWDPIWKFDSYGWYEVVRQYFMGEIFDWERAPVITILVTIGFFTLLLKSRLFPFALIFAFWILMYFGRSTWGGLINLIPGMNDFHQHRFIVGIQIASLFLLPAGLEFVFTTLKKTLDLLRVTRARGAPKAGSPPWVILGLASRQDPQIIKNIIFYILSISLISALAYFTARKTYDYAVLNNKWIYEANSAYRYDEKNFQNLTDRLDALPKARVYAGRPGNWGKDFRLGSTQLYMLFGALNYDISQFLPETWSPLSENEQNFDERVADDYDLLNIRYIVADKNHDFTSTAKLDKKYGPFELYTVPTSGWFDVVTSPMFVTSDKTNYINIVHLWFTSYARRWKMYPLISVEKKPNIPDGMRKILQMKDEVTYIESDESNEVGPRTRSDLAKGKNIFADYPFVFPQATPSGKIVNEKVERQTYSGTVEVPDNCEACFIMFKMSYHPNWTVKLDGITTEKFAVFPFYLAVPVPSGTHTVEFTYRPNNLKTILLFGEIIAVTAGVVYFILRQKPPD